MAAAQTAGSIRRGNNAMTANDMTIQCKGCGQRYQIQDSLAGKQFKCKKCGAVIAIPAIVEPQPAVEPEYRIADLLDEVRPSASPSAPALAKAAKPKSAENPHAAPRTAPEASAPRYRRYEDVPWFRKSWTNSLFILSGFVGLPLIVWCCFNLVTGYVYYNDKDQGKLKTWSMANKVVAGVLLMFYSVVIILALTGRIDLR